MANRGSGSGSYKRGRSPFVVVMGDFDTVPKTTDVMENILDEDEVVNSLKLVFLGRNEASPGVQAVIQQPLYQGRVTYLVGSGLMRSDFQRCQLHHASAVFILPSRTAPDAFEEDEQNTLRSWAVEE